MTDPRSRLLRGGSWLYHPKYCRSAFRDHDRPVNAYNGVGFRVVCHAQGEQVIELSVLPAPENG